MDDLTTSGEFDLLLVPGVAFDARCNRLGHGKGYQYAHDFPGHFVPQDYLGAKRRFYEPTEQGVEKKIKARVDYWREHFAKLNDERTRDEQ